MGLGRRSWDSPGLSDVRRVGGLSVPARRSSRSRSGNSANMSTTGSPKARYSRSARRQPSDSRWETAGHGWRRGGGSRQGRGGGGYKHPRTDALREEGGFVAD